MTTAMRTMNIINTRMGQKLRLASRIHTHITMHRLAMFTPIGQICTIATRIESSWLI
jgi:hypothetical protein